MFVTPMLEPIIIHKSEAFEISQFRPPYVEFACTRVRGELDTPLNLKFGSASICLNYGDDCNFNVANKPDFKLGKHRVCFIIEGTEVTLSPGALDMFICTENLDNSITLF